MNATRKLLFALGIATCMPTAHAATLYFSGVVSNVTQTPGGFANSPVHAGMLVTGTFEFNPATAITGSGGGTNGDFAIYETGSLQMTLDNTLHLSTDVPPGGDAFPHTTVWNWKTVLQDEFQFEDRGLAAFTSDFAPRPLAGTTTVTRSVALSFLASNFSALGSTAIPGASTLAGNLFTSRTITVGFDNGIDEPCGPDNMDFCYAPNSYSFVTTITSISEVPLPPSLLLMGTSLSLLALGKRQRRSA